MSKKPLYRIQFINQGKIYEIYAREVSHGGSGSGPGGGLFGFIEIAGFVFGKRTEVVIDPSEEKLQAEFDGVKRTFIPLQAVIRIDEVAKEGTPKISEAGSNVTPFPVSYYPGGDKQ